MTNMTEGRAEGHAWKDCETGMATIVLEMTMAWRLGPEREGLSTKLLTGSSEGDVCSCQFDLTISPSSPG